MADFEVTGVDELIKQLETLSTGAEEVTDKMLEAGAVILKKEMTARAQAHRDSGAMADSIRATKPKRHSDGVAYIVVRPTGKSNKTWSGRKNKSGKRSGSVSVRNMEKMIYLEYGTSRQPATPVIQPAVNASEGTVGAEMQKVFEQEVGKLVE